jgi:large subunit ribosomal protein LP2
MKHMAAYLLLKLGGNDAPTAAEVTKALEAVGVESDSERLGALLSELEGKDMDELLASGKEMLAKFGSGGGGGGGAAGAGADAVEEKEEEKVEEEEMEVGGGMDMFGGDGDAEGGGY